MEKETEETSSVMGKEKEKEKVKAKEIRTKNTRYDAK